MEIFRLFSLIRLDVLKERFDSMFHYNSDCFRNIYPGIKINIDKKYNNNIDLNYMQIDVIIL